MGKINPSICIKNNCAISVVGTRKSKCSSHLGICAYVSCDRSSHKRRSTNPESPSDERLCSMHDWRERNGYPMDLPSQREIEWFVSPDGYMTKQKKNNRGGKSLVYQHREVMEELIGRSLLPGENVHHKNGIRADNRPENLELWVSSQPSGQRVSDLLEWADEIIERYRTDK